jgi:DNA-binding response OmpR family regulator
VEAWERIKDERPQMLILDVMMPRKNGYELCNEIKKDDKFKDITVLLLTAVADAVPSTTIRIWMARAHWLMILFPNPLIWIISWKLSRIILIILHDG